jgi:hypothetical protein
MFLHSVILEHCCDSPKDLEGQATFERLRSNFSPTTQSHLSSRISDVSIIGNELTF